MQIIVGLGNPGKKYKQNRHNVGFQVLDAICEYHSFGPWRKKFQSLVSEGHFNSKKVILIKPETFMNNSGMAISEVMNFFKLDVTKLTVIHDELDLKVGKIKLKNGGGSAGHNGLKSIDQHVGQNYLRLRIGIDRPQNTGLVAKYVLSDFSIKDKNQIDAVIKHISTYFEKLANDDQQLFLMYINQLLKPIMANTASEQITSENLSNVRSTQNKLSALQRLVKKFKN